MTRKEEILQAARDYVGSVTFSSSSDVIHFENGAKLADEHPVNMWHDMSEEPRKYEYILFKNIHMNYTHTKDVTVSCSAANSLQNSLKDIL